MIKIANKCFDTLGEIPVDRFSEENINRFISENKMTEQQRNLFMAFIQVEKVRRNI